MSLLKLDPLHPVGFYDNPCISQDIPEPTVVHTLTSQGIFRRCSNAAQSCQGVSTSKENPNMSLVLFIISHHSPIITACQGGRRIIYNLHIGYINLSLSSSSSTLPELKFVPLVPIMSYCSQYTYDEANYGDTIGNKTHGVNSHNNNGACFGNLY